MSVAHEAAVAARFDEIAGRFKSRVGSDDYRLRALLRALGPVEGQRVLDLGCGKGRFAAHLRAAGAGVIGLDASAEMLAAARGLDRVRGSAARLPLAGASVDAVVAVEVLEHVHPARLDAVLAEARRVLRPGGVLAIVDKNVAALDATRPWLPALAVKWIDQRRGRWMYPAGGPARERWFAIGGLRRRLGRLFERAEAEPLLSPAESGRRAFRLVPRARRMVLWTARVSGRGGAGG